MKKFLTLSVVAVALFIITNVAVFAAGTKPVITKVTADTPANETAKVVATIEADVPVSTSRYIVYHREKGASAFTSWPVKTDAKNGKVNYRTVSLVYIQGKEYEFKIRAYSEEGTKEASDGKYDESDVFSFTIPKYEKKPEAKIGEVKNINITGTTNKTINADKVGTTTHKITWTSFSGASKYDITVRVYYEDGTIYPNNKNGVLQYNNLWYGGYKGDQTTTSVVMNKFGDQKINTIQFLISAKDSKGNIIANGLSDMYNVEYPSAEVKKTVTVLYANERNSYIKEKEIYTYSVANNETKKVTITASLAGLDNYEYYGSALGNFARNVQVSANPSREITISKGTSDTDLIVIFRFNSKANSSTGTTTPAPTTPTTTTTNSISKITVSGVGVDDVNKRIERGTKVTVTWDHEKASDEKYKLLVVSDQKSPAGIIVKQFTIKNALEDKKWEFNNIGADENNLSFIFTVFVTKNNKETAVFDMSYKYTYVSAGTLTANSGKLKNASLIGKTNDGKLPYIKSSSWTSNKPTLKWEYTLQAGERFKVTETKYNAKDSKSVSKDKLLTKNEMTIIKSDAAKYSYVEYTINLIDSKKNVLDSIKTDKIYLQTAEEYNKEILDSIDEIKNLKISNGLTDGKIAINTPLTLSWEHNYNKANEVVKLYEQKFKEDGTPIDKKPFYRGTLGAVQEKLLKVTNKNCAKIQYRIEVYSKKNLKEPVKEALSPVYYVEK